MLPIYGVSVGYEKSEVAPVIMTAVIQYPLHSTQTNKLCLLHISKSFIRVVYSVWTAEHRIETYVM